MVTVGIVVGAGATSADLSGVLVQPVNVKFKVKTSCGCAGALPSEIFPRRHYCSALRFQGAPVSSLAKCGNIYFSAPNWVNVPAAHALQYVNAIFGFAETAGLWLRPVVR